RAAAQGQPRPRRRERRGDPRPHGDRAQGRPHRRCARARQAAADEGGAGRRGLAAQAGGAVRGRSGHRRHRSRAQGVARGTARGRGGRTGGQAMIRIVLYLLGILALTASLHWLAGQPGTITVEWLGHIAEISVFAGLVLMAILLTAAVLAWSVLRRVWHGPAALARYMSRRRQQRGLDALSSGIIAVGAGDRALAQRYAAEARKALPHEPLTHLLRAQAAPMSGDRATAR